MVEHPAVNRRVAGSSPARGVMVAMRHWVTPVPIPNTMVKTMTADGTWWVTAWESRWPPFFISRNLGPDQSFLIWIFFIEKSAALMQRFFV